MCKEKKIEHFGRFYAALKRLPYSTDSETKDGLVKLYTCNRTSSLREMSREEYDEMCLRLEELSNYRGRLKKWRSHVLHQLQTLGVDTSDWARVNDFCRHPRISGKPFARLSEDDLRSLSVKLRVILKKGGLKPRNESEAGNAACTGFMIVGLDNVGQA